MASKIVGVGVKGTVAGLVVTFDRPISGDGLTLFTTSHFGLNLSTGTSFGITAITRDAADRNKITSVTFSSTAGWSTGNFFALLTDSGTTTFSTIAAAVAAASAGDQVIVYPRSSFGDRQIRTVSTITIAADIVVETDTIGDKNIIRHDATLPTFDLTSPCTIRDFLVATSETDTSFQASHSSGLVIVERCIGMGSDGGIFSQFSTGDVTFKNCFAVNSEGDGFVNAASTGIVSCQNCAALYSGRAGFRNAGGATAIFNCDNCVAYRNVVNYDTPFSGTLDGDNNVSDTGSIPTGTGNLTLQTLDKVRPAFDFITGQPWDWRFLDEAGSVLVDGGTVISGLTLDIDGRTRSVTVPNIGPTEGFAFFGDAPSTPTVPAAPVIS